MNTIALFGGEVDTNTNESVGTAENSQYVTENFNNSNQGAARPLGIGVFLILKTGTLGNMKKICFESEELSKIRSIDARLRLILDKTICLPSSIGLRILPLSLIEKTHTLLLTHEQQRKELVGDFITCYPQILSEAKVAMGDQFDVNEYPSWDELPDLFAFDWQYVPLTTPGSVKNTYIFGDESHRTKKRDAETFKLIAASLRSDLLEVNSRLQSALTVRKDGKPNRLFQSSLFYIQKFVDSFPDRNIISDTKLASLVEKTRYLLENVSIEQLRESSELREKIRVGLEDISLELGNND